MSGFIITMMMHLFLKKRLPKDVFVPKIYMFQVCWAAKKQLQLSLCNSHGNLKITVIRETGEGRRVRRKSLKTSRSHEEGDKIKCLLLKNKNKKVLLLRNSKKASVILHNLQPTHTLSLELFLIFFFSLKMCGRVCDWCLYQAAFTQNQTLRQKRQSSIHFNVVRLITCGSGQGVLGKTTKNSILQI